MFTIFKNRNTREKVISVVLFHKGWGTTNIIVDLHLITIKKYNSGTLSHT